MESIWSEIEKNIGDKFPPCVKKILNFSAYDSFSVLKELNEQKILEIEQYISDCGQTILNELNCCHSQKYRNQQQFKFLPGHRAILLSLPGKIPKIVENDDKKNVPQSNGEFSVILNELIKTAEINNHKFKNHAEYSDIIRFFFTYVYLMSGKSAYETLQRNLPIPSTKTICKYIFE